MLRDVVMMGGAKQLKKTVAATMVASPMTVVVGLMVMFVLRALVVQYTYNAVMPKIRSETTVKPLTFTEALLFTLFVSFLFP